VSQDVRAWTVAQRAAFEAQIPTEVLRQNPSRRPVHHAGDTGKAALPVPRRAVDRPQDNRRQSQNCRSAATAVEGVPRTPSRRSERSDLIHAGIAGHFWLKTAAKTFIKLNL